MGLHLLLLEGEKESRMVKQPWPQKEMLLCLMQTEKIDARESAVIQRPLTLFLQYQEQRLFE